MIHTESSTKVYYTKDYSMFRMILGNRQLNESKIKKIRTDIENGTDVLRYCPIMVVEKNGVLDIIDGQHRFWVSKVVKSHVWYIIAEDMSLYDIAKMNSNTEKWKGKDFINCYSQLGNENYLKLQHIMDNYPVPLSTLISLLQSGKVNDGGGTKNKFERGEFLVSHYSDTTDILEKAKAFEHPSKFSRQFIKALLRIETSGKVKILAIAEKVNEDPAALEIQDDEKKYLTVLENIFNKGKKIRTVIY